MKTTTWHKSLRSLFPLSPPLPLSLSLSLTLSLSLSHPHTWDPKYVFSSRPNPCTPRIPDSAHVDFWMHFSISTHISSRHSWHKSLTYPMLWRSECCFMEIFLSVTHSASLLHGSQTCLFLCRRSWNKVTFPKRRKKRQITSDSRSPVSSPTALLCSALKSVVGLQLVRLPFVRRCPQQHSAGLPSQPCVITHRKP